MNPFWITQKTMCHVFKVSNTNIIKHLNNIFEYREFNKEEMSFNPTIQLIVELL
jgi:hypothetical protein